MPQSHKVVISLRGSNQSWGPCSAFRTQSVLTGLGLDFCKLECFTVSPCHWVNSWVKDFWVLIKKRQCLHNVLIKQKVLLSTELFLLRCSSWEQFIDFFLDTGLGLWQFLHPFMQTLLQRCNSAIWTFNSFHLCSIFFLQTLDSCNLWTLDIFWSPHRLQNGN